jgi:uncharacterized protein (TIRG00374 family)
LSVALVAVIFLYFLPRIVDYGRVLEAISAMTWIELFSLAALAIWNQMTYVLLEVAARPGLTHLQAVTITMTSTALANTLPAGGALGVGVQTGMYSSYGFAKPDIAISLMVTGIWNTFVKLALPLVALALLALGGDAGGALVAASAVGVAIVVMAVALFGMALRSERGALLVGRVLESAAGKMLRLLRKPPLQDWSAAVVDFRRRAIDLLRARWLRVTVTALASHLTLYLVLLLTLRHMGIPNAVVTWQELLAAFAFVRLISVVPITPGGLGVVELGMTAALVAAGGPEAQVVAAVLVFRLLTFVFPIPLGAVTFLMWRKVAARSVTSRVA